MGLKVPKWVICVNPLGSEGLIQVLSRWMNTWVSTCYFISTPLDIFNLHYKLPISRNKHLWCYPRCSYWLVQLLLFLHSAFIKGAAKVCAIENGLKRKRKTERNGVLVQIIAQSRQCGRESISVQLLVLCLHMTGGVPRRKERFPPASLNHSAPLFCRITLISVERAKDEHRRRIIPHFFSFPLSQ